MRKLFLILFFLYAFGTACAEEFSGRVVAVLDGDTVMVARVKGQPIKVRLAGIDAPEREQEYGMESGESLRDLVLRKQVIVSSKGTDDYGRLLAEISVSGLNVNHEQVRRGMAWEYSRYHDNREFIVLRREAQQARRGLWAGKSAIEPSRWRRQHPVVPAVSPGAAFSSQAASDPACSKKRCAEMLSCEEAKYYLAHCHVKTMDGDGDGVPCEKLCYPRQ